MYTGPDGDCVVTAAVLIGIAKVVGIRTAIGGVSYTANLGFFVGRLAGPAG